MKFVFTKNDKKFHITKTDATDGEYRIELVEFTLHLKRIEVHPDVMERIERKLDSGKKEREREREREKERERERKTFNYCYFLLLGSKAKYFFDHYVTRSHFIPVRTTTTRIENCIRTDYLPHTVLVGMIDQPELQGATDVRIAIYWCITVILWLYYGNYAYLLLFSEIKFSVWTSQHIQALFSTGSSYFSQPTIYSHICLWRSMASTVFFFISGFWYSG